MLTEQSRWDEVHHRQEVPDHAIRIHGATASDLADTGDEPPELEQLRWARWVQAEASLMVEAAVKDARDAGASWGTVGPILGTSRQAAWERFRHLDR
jgi:hypothetical protein